MKREELTPIELECNMGPDVNGVVHREPWKAYDIDEVDHLLDEKDAEIEDLLRQNRELCQALQVMYSKEEYGKLQTEIETLKAKLENVQESAYADSVDAGMRERRLRRALYKACANWALAEIECEQLDSQMFAFGMTSDKEVAWKKVERKCQAMAEKLR